ncbi:hypothetical protein TNCT_454461 [Trichonephila clavata]|uniref:Uncharacterized protein n=1 Tax=Trichonephila clavata TaxID=2740835 RepID=A0A8X6HRF9_TRICU|nr:hypothetical protein TNCT_454461 [Trichonephila clavata]
MKTDISIASMAFQHILVKTFGFPPLNYFSLVVLLKRDLSKLKPTVIDGLGNIIKEEKQAIPVEIARKSFLSWKAQADI